ncbi:lipopolysaccharide transport periplasmic protein LptA [Sulfurisoma sediminicola]|uniref:Lipopolysaccharide export system protein LptA n=1 Tax=Sulfurisoma sediminicola TaxID=1381557 RepID=A0A497XBQ0_9PROT|nr:lipopolysaccharide transport periplasmic protein LptA [Sulfurisoma sediminicola]RLJ63760.1 lipopolysaccharide export system protein LptA [Sulfurisoma sediminicola]
MTNSNVPVRRWAPALCLALLWAAGPALAERADRDKPVNLEADRITVDDIQKVQVFEGNVQLVQGTLVIRTDRLVVKQDTEGFQQGTAYGGANGLARFRQKREGKDEFIEGEAERIEYESKAEKAQFFVRAMVRSGLDEVRGQYISYDGKTERYLVTSGPDGTSAATAGKPDRVRAVIQSKSAKGTPPPPKGVEIPLAPAPAIANPRDE